ncbi:MAG: Rieske 2Fe-2S domain-containing protein [Pirellulales bacterium]|nr:Rieske 2Fe-2S domain-containing protein [Pirellulales bacterium]
MSNNAHSPRRSFLAAVVAVVAGAIATLTPLAIGIVAFLTPLFRRRESPLVRVALLEQVPDDGVPRSFPVTASRVDAWNRSPAQRIGAVYLVRNPGEKTPIALSAKCPHAGCFVGFAPGADHFNCPCHTSSFKLDGARVRGDAEVSPRDMDRLPVEVREIDGPGDLVHFEVWVEFIDFQTGHKEQIRTA